MNRFRYVQNRKIENPNNSKMFGSNKTKGLKQDSQNRLSSPMLEGCSYLDHLLWLGCLCSLWNRHYPVMTKSRFSYCRVSTYTTIMTKLILSIVQDSESFQSQTNMTLHEWNIQLFVTSMTHYTDKLHWSLLSLRKLD